MAVSSASPGQSAILSGLCLNSEQHRQRAPLSPCGRGLTAQAFVIIQRTSLQWHAEAGPCVLGCWIFISDLCQRGTNENSIIFTVCFCV